MAISLIKEDGTGLSGSNCYCDLSDLAIVAELMNFDLSPYSDETQKSAIWVCANQYIDRKKEFKGDPVQANQGMKAYTDLVTFADAGKNFIQANCEGAILHLQGYLLVAPDAQNANGNIIEEMSKLDVLEERVKYEEGTSVRGEYDTSRIDALLAPYIKPSTGGVALRVT